MSRHAEIFSAPAEPPAPATAAREKQTGGALPEMQCASPGIDEVWKLVQQIFLVGKDGKGPRVVAFCGANRGAGSSWVCARTGESLARQSAGRVCLIDANLRTPSLHAQFEAKAEPGFAELIRSSRPATDFLQGISGSGLWLVAAGSVESGPNESLNAQKLAVRFAELRAQFDFLLVDTPAIDIHPDAVLLGHVTDGIVLIVGSDSTRRETARNAKLSFETAQIPVLGAVLNKRTFPIPDAIYRKI